MDIEAVADYVLAHIKGKGELNYSDCHTPTACHGHPGQAYRASDMQRGSSGRSDVSASTM